MRARGDARGNGGIAVRDAGRTIVRRGVLRRAVGSGSVGRPGHRCRMPHVPAIGAMTPTAATAPAAASPALRPFALRAGAACVMAVPMRSGMAGLDGEKSFQRGGIGSVVRCKQLI